MFCPEFGDIAKPSVNQQGILKEVKVGYLATIVLLGLNPE